MKLKQDTLTAVAAILGNGYKCYVNLANEEVFSSEDISLEARKAGDFKEFIPLEGPEMFKLMEAYCASVEDFGNQSELMECLMYEQPFQSFKKKVYALHIADDWIAYRTEKIASMLTEA